MDKAASKDAALPREMLWAESAFFINPNKEKAPENAQDDSRPERVQRPERKIVVSQRERKHGRNKPEEPGKRFDYRVHGRNRFVTVLALAPENNPAQNGNVVPRSDFRPAFGTMRRWKCNVHAARDSVRQNVEKTPDDRPDAPDPEQKKDVQSQRNKIIKRHGS